MNKKINKGPWYNDTELWIETADRYIRAINNAKFKKTYRNEIQAFREFNICRVIFESNLIEGAGLSEGETRKVISKHFPSIPSEYHIFQKSYFKQKDPIHIYRKDELKNMLEAVVSHGLDPQFIYPSISMKDKSRDNREVLQHYTASLQAEVYASEFIASKLEHFLFHSVNIFRKNKKLKTFKSMMSEYNMSENEDRILNEILKMKNHRGINLITGSKIKKLHKLLAEGLMPKDSGVKAGVYRIDNRIVGWDISFPPPSLVAKSMRLFTKNSQVIIENSLQGHINKYEAAAKVSYDFVRIHPFPDFNGRLSRIIMNLILKINFCPMPIALRGKSKDKHRYFTALKRANRGDLGPLTCLIAMRVAQTFEELDEHFCMAGLEPIITK